MELLGIILQAAVLGFALWFVSLLVDAIFALWEK